MDDNNNDPNEKSIMASSSSTSLSDRKAELVKKKQMLEDLKKRKHEREKLKLNSSQSDTSLTNLDESFNSSFNQLRHRPNDILHEFNNLNADEIFKKIGINGSVVSDVNENGQDYSNVSFNVKSTTSNSEIKINNKNNNNHRIDSHSVEFLRKKIEKLDLKPQINLNKVDIFPPEIIKYTKETQTIERLNNNGVGGELSSETDDELDVTKNKSNNNVNSNNKNNMNNKKRKKVANAAAAAQLKPLAFYEDVFVYDTLQWEDEFTQHSSGDDTKDNQKSINQVNGNADSIDDSSSPSLHINNNNSANQTVFDNQKESVSYEEDEEPDNLHEQILHDIDYDDFLHFMVVKRPIVERALRQNENNIFYDYSSQTLNEKLKEEKHIQKIELKKVFSSNEWSSSVVTCLDWSLQYPEMILCSYDNISYNYAESDSEAVTAIWNIKSDQKTAQQIFTSTSLITSCGFSPFHPNLILAGTYSGQIIMWDIRSNKRTPIQRSSLSISSHVNPVYCIKVVGTSESQSLISISNDGKLCSWSLENLNLPIESQDLFVKSSTSTNKSVYATCFDFQSVILNQQSSTTTDDSNNQADLVTPPQTLSSSSQVNQRNAVIGAEDGLVHSLKINSNKFNITNTYDHHFGPITSVSCFPEYILNNPNEKSFDNYDQLESFSHLFLTSSFDSTVKLWNMKDDQTPIYTFECHDDYVYDVAWSPIHPSLFACVDGSGKLDLWNLNKDFETPSASISVDNRTRALNKLKWSRSGMEIAVGDDNGNISIFELNENLARPSHDDFKLLQSSIDNLKLLTNESIGFGKNTDSLNSLIESFR